MLDRFFKKEKPFSGIQGFGGGIGSSNSSPTFEASGGNTVTTSGGYIIHKFTSPGTFSVTLGEADIELLMVGWRWRWI